ncbi:hypothetical protein HDV62DRAFT_339095 [Trichoderma sp. SZMC 28011]
MVRPRQPTFPLMAAMACLGGDQWLLGVEAAQPAKRLALPLPTRPCRGPQQTPWTAQARALLPLTGWPMGAYGGPMELRRSPFGGPCSCLAPNSARLAWMAGSGTRPLKTPAAYCFCWTEACLHDARRRYQKHVSTPLQLRS